jgi:rhodanese-related sulfurtransferase
MRTTLTRAVLLLSAGAAFGLAANAARGAQGLVLGEAVLAGGGTAACGATATALRSGSLSVGDAAMLRGQPGVAFADTRTPDDYARGHVSGAWHVPCYGSVALAAASLTRMGNTRTVVLYGQDDAEAQLAAQELVRRGFGDVRVMQGGWPAWQASGLPAESGPCEECRKP